MSEEGVIDRFENEGELVVIEMNNKSTAILSRDQFVGEIHVNDVVVKQDSGGLWKTDPQKTAKRLEELDALMKDVWEKGEEDENS